MKPDRIRGESLDALIAKAQTVVRREAEAVQALADQFDESLGQVLPLLLGCQGHVLVIGAGTSHAVAARFAHLLACCGIPAICLSAADGVHGGSGAVTPRDVVFAISKGGHSDEVNRFVEIARRRGARVIAQTEAADSPLARMADAIFKVEIAGDVDPYGMIATGSSLAAAAAGDALCVLLLELSGYTRDDFGITHPGGAVGKGLAAKGEAD